MGSDFLNKIKKQYPQEGYARIELAYNLSRRAHEGQKRISGEEYFVHPLAVADILADLGMDADTVCAALLHDVVEDTDHTYGEIVSLLGSSVADLVEGVTKLEKYSFHSQEQQQNENVRKMLLAMSNDIRVVFIKLADRLHNMRTLNSVSDEQKRRKSRETLEIYAPLAGRLGIYRIKWELEDLALLYSKPEAYRELVQRVAMSRKERQETIQQIILEIHRKLEEEGISAEIDGRPKHFYSIYRKMVEQNHAFEQIYDLMAIRIIVGTVSECYSVLGIIHATWKMVPDRFKDYISMPKANGYQSLHTTLVGPRDFPFEVQIRTLEMHRMAEYGVAAHWKYKEGIGAADPSQEQRLNWVMRIVEAQEESADANEFVENMKMDMFVDEVFVFTPKGKVINLPKGATPLDFAYAIHSQVGNKCAGARINGKMVPLTTALKTGDIVEIITSGAARGPSRDWLKIVRTSSAKSKIRAWFKREMRDENISKGRDMLEDAAKRAGYSWPHLARSEWMEPLFRKYTFNSMDDLYATVGYGGVTTGQILQRLIEEHKKTARHTAQLEAEQQAKTESAAHKEKEKATVSNGVRVKGEANMLVRFAHCCTPVFGDPIVGYITRGRGVSIHRADCTNLRDLTQIERFIEVSWETQGSASYRACIQIISADRAGLLADLVRLLDKIKMELAEINSRVNKNGTAIINLTVTIENTDQLDKVMQQMRSFPGVQDVFRVNA